MSFPCIPRAWTWLLFGIIALCALAPLPLTAQPIGILRQHGINSDSMTWKQANDSLAIKYAVPIRRFTTGSSGAYETQASTLLSRMGGPFSGWAYAGHSNGAQVGREATSLGASYAGIVSVGSPLQGAWIAQSVNNHSVVRFVDNVVYETFNPLATIAHFFQVGQDYHIEALFDLLDEIADAATAAEYIVNIGPAFLGPNLLQALVPGSAYLSALNGARLSSERSHEAIRLSIVSSMSTNKGIQFRSVFSAGTAASLADFYDFLSGPYLAAAIHTATYSRLCKSLLERRRLVVAVLQGEFRLSHEHGARLVRADWCARCQRLYAERRHRSTRVAEPGGMDAGHTVRAGRLTQ